MPRIQQIFFIAIFSLTAAISSGQDSLFSVVNLCNRVQDVTVWLNVFSNDPAFANAKNAIEKAAIDKNEHGVMFGRDASGKMIHSGIVSEKTRNASSVNINFPGAFADMHNHPGNTAPSAGDIYNLIKVNRHHSAFDTRCAMLANGTIYAIVITDRQKADSFISKYPPEQTAGYSPRFPEKLFSEFAEIKSYLINIQEMDRMKADEIATAFILDKYNCGVDLFLYDGSKRFSRVVVREMISGNGNRFYQMELCAE
ncbi:hypothetical protein LZZ85_02135 [Terrimonas sp. NA20]|uniref:Uncharacterized protein n=1 Tax=Terrimonas ginsenosidimutans TaxID=2908004 RepID=A0ABS9KL60_9BACT|nr:hypothetical protein [Terrimonas ginsenosidimutans]MCG2613052.1 hypothetical protein [Terrimonas ginsenosidimutans]